MVNYYCFFLCAALIMLVADFVNMIVDCALLLKRELLQSCVWLLLFVGGVACGGVAAEGVLFFASNLLGGNGGELGAISAS